MEGMALAAVFGAVVGALSLFVFLRCRRAHSEYRKKCEGMIDDREQRLLESEWKYSVLVRNLSSGIVYPYGLQGENIPMSARVVALCDVYDALISERPYKKAFLHEEAVKVISSESGRHFDPELVRVFLENAEEFKAISEQHG